MNNRVYYNAQAWHAPADDQRMALKALKRALERHIGDEPIADIDPGAWHRWSLEHGRLMADMLRLDEELNPPCEWLDDTQADEQR